jgi:hypothetical protein
MRAILLLALSAAAAHADEFKKIPGKDADRYVYAPMKAFVVVPAGLMRSTPKKNDEVAYQFSFKDKASTFELRFQFNSLTETPERKRERERCVKEKTCVMADVDAATPVWGETLAANLAGGDVGFRAFPEDGVKKEFAADWGYVSAPFDLDPKRDVNRGFKLGQVVVVSRRGVGKIYQILMTYSIETLIALNRTRLFYSTGFEGARPPGPPEK